MTDTIIKTDLTFDDNALYTPPDIRKVEIATLSNRLETVRQRRLIAAVEYQKKATARVDKEANKFAEQYTKLRERLEKKMTSIREDLDAFDRDLNKLIDLSNKLAITE